MFAQRNNSITILFISSTLQIKMLTPLRLIYRCSHTEYIEIARATENKGKRGRRRREERERERRHACTLTHTHPRDQDILSPGSQQMISTCNVTVSICGEICLGQRRTNDSNAWMQYSLNSSSSTLQNLTIKGTILSKCSPIRCPAARLKKK